MPAVAVLAVFPFEVRDGARCAGFKRRIRRRQDGERHGLKEDDGQHTALAKVPRMSRRNRLHSYAARVFGMPSRGTPDEGIKLSQVAWRVKLATRSGPGPARGGCHARLNG